MTKKTMTGPLVVESSDDGKLHISYIPDTRQVLEAGKEYEFIIEGSVAELSPPPIQYKHTYNKDRGLPEPKWGDPAENTQCPTCGSQDMRFSGSPDDPEEIFGSGSDVRCVHCGHITDWYEAHKQRENHPTDTPMKVIGAP